MKNGHSLDPTAGGWQASHRDPATA